MSNFLNDLPGEVSDGNPNCSECADSGVYDNFVGERDFCDCASGEIAHSDWCEEESDAHARQEERDYQAGVARGNLHSAERKIYGSQLADEFAMMDELNDYNWGL